MADSAPGGASDFNTKMIEEFRANEGRVGGAWAGTTLILIHHIGARSGTERVTPLGCSPQGAGRFAIVALAGSNAAATASSTRSSQMNSRRARTSSAISS